MVTPRRSWTSVPQKTGEQGFLACRYGSGIPNEKSSNETTVLPLDSLPPFCAKKIASVINNSPMAAQNLKIDKFGGYKAESRDFLRIDGEASGVCMWLSFNELSL